MSRPEMARHDAAFMVAEWPTRAPDRHPDTLEWIARIEAARAGLETPPCDGACAFCEARYRTWRRRQAIRIVEAAS